MKKLTYEFIKEDIESKGYKVLSNHYINSKKSFAGLKILSSLYIRYNYVY